MSFTTQTNEAGVLPGGQRAEVHACAFAGAADDVEVNTNLQEITGWAFGLNGTPGATELLSLNETVNDYGRVNVSGGSVTVHRAAHTTAGLIFCLILFGR